MQYGGIPPLNGTDTLDDGAAIPFVLASVNVLKFPGELDMFRGIIYQ